MIVSHRHRIIFLRTEKTASTALTEALLPHLGAEDIVFGRSPDLPKWLPQGSLRRNFPKLFGLHQHALAKDVRAVLGPKVFDRYTKFAVERNVWDRQVSLYHHRKSRRHDQTRSFARDMANPLYRYLHHTRLNNWQVYAIGDEVVADHVLVYDRLDQQFPALLETIGLPPITLPHRNNTHRTGARHYSAEYTPKVRDLVGQMYRREVDHFGFVFDDRSAALASSHDDARTPSSGISE